MGDIQISEPIFKYSSDIEIFRGYFRILEPSSDIPTRFLLNLIMKINYEYKNKSQYNDDISA